MLFTAYLETKKDYDSSDIVVAFHKCLERGEQQLRTAGDEFHADIILDFRNNSPIIEQDINEKD